MQGHYAGKSHAHKPFKGKGSYRREKLDEEALERERSYEELEWTEEEEEAFEELERRQEGGDE